MNLKLPSFENTAVLVAGDVMLDRYWSGPTARISPEAPVPVVRVDVREDRPGGAANVAVNLAALGVRTALAGLVGNDEASRVLDGLLAARGIATHLRRIEGMPTITKLRVLSRHQQLIRLDFEEDFRAREDARSPGLSDAALDGAQVLVISDYGKGVVDDAPALIEKARARGIPVLVDPKGRSFEPYRGATLVTPNLAEFEAVAGPVTSDADLAIKAGAVRAEYGLDALLITLSERGMLLIRADQDPLHLPTHAREVYDVTGAGDTVIATLAAALAAGEDLERAAMLANLAAGIVVGKLGTGSVAPAELRAALQRGRGYLACIHTEDELLAAVAAAHADGERIVMTNGCFDILHEGHVAYLEQARRLGDRLIVAVNDDASVRRLKGNERPVNALARRMAVLAGLASVDWVVPFSEDTPERLIRAVGPDVLVKGGDYRPEEIAGGASVRAAGGEVRVLPYIDGHSTTGTIARIRGAR